MYMVKLTPQRIALAKNVNKTAHRIFDNFTSFTPGDALKINFIYSVSYFSYAIIWERTYDVYLLRKSEQKTASCFKTDSVLFNSHDAKLPSLPAAQRSKLRLLTAP